MNKLTKDEFLKLFDPSVHGKIEEAARVCKASHVVCCEVLDMCSSQFGSRKALCVGPTCTFKFEDVQREHFRLGDVPSRFHYPVSYWEIEVEANRQGQEKVQDGHDR